MSHFLYFHSYRKILRPKEVLKLYQASLCTALTKWEWWRPEGRFYQRCRSIAIIDYLSSKFKLRSNIFNSYNLRDSEKSLLFPCHEPITIIEIASSTVELFCGTLFALWCKTSKISSLAFNLETCTSSRASSVPIFPNYFAILLNFPYISLFSL